MLRSKKLILIALLVAGGAIGLNWDFYLGVLGRKPAGSPQEASLERPSHPAPAPAPITAGFAPEAIGNEPAAGSAAPSGSMESPKPATRAPQLPEGQSPPPPIATALERLAGVFAQIRSAKSEPEPRRMTALHSDAEAVAGLTLEQLLAEADKAREARREAKDRPETTLVKEAKPPETAPAPAPAPAFGASKAAGPGAEVLLEEAALTCILNCGPRSMCILGGKRMRIGDTFARTKFKVLEILDREIRLTDGETTISKELAPLTTGKGSGTREEKAPEEEGGS